eukprot:1154740-Pelagomonas_calceolata.AAC.2
MDSKKALIKDSIEGRWNIQTSTVTKAFQHQHMWAQLQSASQNGCDEVSPPPQNAAALVAARALVAPAAAAPPAALVASLGAAAFPAAKTPPPAATILLLHQMPQLTLLQLQVFLPAVAVPASYDA